MKALFILFLLSLTILAQQAFPPSFWSPAPVTAAPYSCFSTELGGTNGMDHQGAGLVGAANSGIFTFSCWYRLDAGDGTLRFFFNIENGSFANKLKIYLTGANKFALEGWNAAGTEILTFTSTATTFVAGAGWHHIFAYVDLSNSGTRGVYLDGSSVAGTWSTYTNDSMELSQVKQFVGSVGDASFWNGCLSEFWFVTGTAITDPTKFISGGKPVNLGTTGNGPGVTPVCYYNKVYSSWGTDASGNGNNTSPVHPLQAGSNNPCQ